MIMSRLCLAVALLVVLVSPAVAQGDFQRGVSFYKQGQYAKAAPEFEQMVAANPKYEDGWRILGDCYLKLKKYNEATSAFQKALQLDSNQFASYYGLALAYYNSERYRDAVSTLARAERLARTPKDQQQVYRTRGSAYFNLQAFNEATADLSKANAIQRANYQDSLQLGIAYYHIGNVGEAEKFLRQALSLSGNSAEAKKYLAQMDYARAINAIEKKDFAQATTLLRQHLEDHPQDSDAWFNLGLARLFSNDMKGAEDAFQQSVKLDPGNWQSHDRLGYIYEKNKNYAKALQHYQKASSGSAQAKASVARIRERMRRQQQGKS
ncbi:MAG: tetratricopeptide repeat protein [Acidobacteria bacterium]|nr:MAG: tetratricopeptide repeat protein [Acidobacteriota bacterium]